MGPSPQLRLARVALLILALALPHPVLGQSLAPDPPALEPAAAERTSYMDGAWDPVCNRMLMFGGYDAAGSRWHDLWALEWSTTAGVEGARSVSCLRPPAPNPASGATMVSYSLARAGRVHLTVHDVSGRLVRTLVDGHRPAGPGTVSWNGADQAGSRLSTGVYFVRLAGPGIRQTRKVILLQ